MYLMKIDTDLSSESIYKLRYTKICNNCYKSFKYSDNDITIMKDSGVGTCDIVRCPHCNRMISVHRK